ncbi:hypothetical protein [Brumimicrobium sp.]|uniref:hypothetical protein n=1 Tax=Brumimicrobium sp. TaxID=2029867 RepID=UPI00262C1104|nr:hypothetical protein [uncultured Brumimicrobium sp.]
MKKQLFYLFTGALIFSAFIGCKAKSTSELNSKVAKFVSNSESVVSYGYIDFNAIKDKSALTEIPDLGAFITDQLSTIESALKMSDKIHFALEGPLNNDGLPKVAYVFMSVENTDSLQVMFEKTGLFFEEEGDLMVSYEMNMAVGFNDQTAVMVSANFGDDPKGLLLNSFAAFELKEADERVTKILAEPTDVLVASHLENLYKTSNTSLKNLSKEQQEEVENLVDDGHFFLALDFNKGDLTTRINISNVSDELKEAHFFKKNGASEITKSIGPGTPLVAMALSFDVDKLEDLMKRFSPDSDQSLFGVFGTQGKMIESIVGDELSDMMNGNVGMMIGSEEPKEDLVGMGSIPNVNLYLGLGKDTENMMNLLQTFSEDGEVVDLGDGYYQYNQSMMLIKDNAIVMHSEDESKESFKVDAMDAVSDMEDFGEKPFSFYIDLKRFVGSELDRTGGQYDMLLRLADHFSIVGDNEEVVMKLVLKDKNENILKQVVKSFEEQLKGQLGNLSF